MKPICTRSECRCIIFHNKRMVHAEHIYFLGLDPPHLFSQRWVLIQFFIKTSMYRKEVQSTPKTIFVLILREKHCVRAWWAVSYSLNVLWVNFQCSILSENLSFDVLQQWLKYFTPDTYTDVPRWFLKYRSKVYKKLEKEYYLPFSWEKEAFPDLKHVGILTESCFDDSHDMMWSWNWGHNYGFRRFVQINFACFHQ